MEEGEDLTGDAGVLTSASLATPRACDLDRLFVSVNPSAVSPALTQ